MARDDYDKLVCIILTYLYASIKGKTKTDPEIFLQPMTKMFPVDEDYFNLILDNMQKDSLIQDAIIKKAWGGDIIYVDVSAVRITSAGIHYLKDDSHMQKVLIWLRDNAVDLAGMVTTVIGLIS